MLLLIIHGRDLLDHVYEAVLSSIILLNNPSECLGWRLRVFFYFFLLIIKF